MARLRWRMSPFDRFPIGPAEPGVMSVCPSCGALCVPGAVYCPACGQALPLAGSAPAPDVMADAGPQQQAAEDVPERVEGRGAGTAAVVSAGVVVPVGDDRDPPTVDAPKAMVYVVPWWRAALLGAVCLLALGSAVLLVAFAGVPGFPMGGGTVGGTPTATAAGGSTPANATPADQATRPGLPSASTATPTLPPSGSGPGAATTSTAAPGPTATPMLVPTPTFTASPATPFVPTPTPTRPSF